MKTKKQRLRKSVKMESFKGMGSSETGASRKEAIARGKKWFSKQV